MFFCRIHLKLFEILCEPRHIIRQLIRLQIRMVCLIIAESFCLVDQLVLHNDRTQLYLTGILFVSGITGNDSRKDHLILYLLFHQQL